jgi:hypothetical protein
MLRFADYIVVITDNEGNLQSILETTKLTKQTKAKTKVFVCSRNDGTQTLIKLDSLHTRASE